MRALSALSWLLTGMLVAVLAALPAIAVTQGLPKLAPKYLPTLVQKQRAIWPAAPLPSFLGAQVEQESCISLTSSKCWNPNVQLKTSREWGRGLGQVTTAYKADGTVRFDKQAELRAQFSSLRGWTTDRWSDPGYQLTAVVEMNRMIYSRQKEAASPRDQLAFTLSAYNGGEGGVLQDRRLCANTVWCDPARWTGNVELTSLKTRLVRPGYGQSAFSINRQYVSNVLVLRRPKYESFFK